MAKKTSGPNMSEEIRKVLRSTPTASNKEVFEVLVSKFGKGKFNEASCGVAVSNQRKNLGISRSKKRSVRKPGVAGRGRPLKAASVGVSVNLDALRAAKSLLAAVDGDDAAAISAIRQLHSLQLG
jgi:hypothetical protein